MIMFERKTTEKKSISSRIEKSYDKLVKASGKKGHRFFDRKVAYMVNKILQEWADKE